MTTRLPWFRMWTESRNDSKLDALNDREFRIWHKLLCYAAESKERGTIDYIDPEFVAMELRLGVDELDSAISRMVRLRLIERSDSRVSFPSFADRQYEKPSDRPEATRERKQRQRSKDKSRDVTRDVTPTEQNRSEKDQRGSGGDVDNSRTIGDIIAGIRDDLEAKQTARS